jgi:hypothetical protein
LHIKALGFPAGAWLYFAGMPVFHFTFHAYRSWNADHPRGWVQHGERGIKRASQDLAIYRDGLSKHPEVRFTVEQQRAIILHVHDICGRREWHPYAISADATHVHIVVAWDQDVTMEKVRDTVKRLLGYLLAQDAGTKGKPWFSHGADEKAVRSKRHLRYLLYEYLPKHLGEFWRREMM